MGCRVTENCDQQGAYSIHGTLVLYDLKKTKTSDPQERRMDGPLSQWVIPCFQSLINHREYGVNFIKRGTGKRNVLVGWAPHQSS